MSTIKRLTQRDAARPGGPDAYVSAAAEFCVLLASSSPPEMVDDFTHLVERLPIASKRQASKWGARAKALADVGDATTRYQIALTRVNARRASSRRDFLRQFRDLKKWPTKRRLLNILERDKDENDLRPAECAIRFAILHLGLFEGEVPPDWIERLGKSPALLRKVAKTVCEHFAHKIDGRGRPRNTPFETYADRLVQIYERLAGRPITYSKATDTSRGRKAGDPYGLGLDVIVAGLRLIDKGNTPYQAVTQIERIRAARVRA
jgi:hypothetical protein